ncbi:MAG: hypothetical protein JWR37_5367, partial [Mycobacterium sp.]|nr:hypothetical protein [Mycobacterium sp.]
GAMRAAGDENSVTLAVTHLLRVGPASAVITAASRIDLDSSTRTTLLADIEFITAAADVLDEAGLQRHARWALRVLADPSKLHERLQPSFVIPIYVLGMLTRLAPLLRQDSMRDLIDHVTALAPQTEASVANSYARLIGSIPPSSWTAEDLEKLKARNGDDFALDQAIAQVLGRTDPETHAGLLAAIAQGDLAALTAYGDVTALPADTVVALVAKLRTRIAEQIAALNNGGTALPPPNFAGTLALVNVEHPDHADWQPVVHLLGTESEFTEFLQRPLQTLRALRTRVPDAAAEQLRPIIHSLTSATDYLKLPGQPDLRGLAAATLAAIAPESLSDDDMWTLMSGDAQRRAAAAQVIADQQHPEQLDLLASLAFDQDPHVRAQAAGGLAYWITQDVAAHRALGLLTRILDSPGTDAARMIARVLDGKQTTTHIAQLADLLRDHRSGYVRSVSAQHTTTT